MKDILKNALDFALFMFMGILSIGCSVLLVIFLAKLIFNF